MNNFSMFMSQNALKEENVKYVASKRFVDGKKPMEWEVTSIDSAKDEEIRKSCTHKVPIPGKRGQFTMETDYNSYLAKLAVACTVFPDLDNKELQDSYQVLGAENLIRKMLLSGEYSAYLEQIQKINGFDVPMDDLVEEAKN